MSNFASAVEVIEAGYEFTLAYAAQGFEAGPPLRRYVGSA